jgi:hypothetical protein
MGLGNVKMAWLNPDKPDGGLPDVPTYDIMLTVDAVHDMAQPDQVLPLVRKVAIHSFRILAPAHCCTHLRGKLHDNGFLQHSFASDVH